MSLRDDTSGDQEWLRVAVLASGEGSNLQAIIDSVDRRFGVRVVCALSDRRDAQALKRAESAEIPTAVFATDDYEQPAGDEAPGSTARFRRDAAIVQHLRDLNVDLVVLAGYMQLLGENFVAAFAGRTINVHPSLLPLYPGLNAIQQALDAGEHEVGVTVHYVDDGIDTGDVIMQQAVAVLPGESLAQLTERVHAVEHKMLPEVIAQIAAERIRDSAAT